MEKKVQAEHSFVSNYLITLDFLTIIYLVF